MPEKIEEIQILEYTDMPSEEYIPGGTNVCPGCGILLGLRLATKITGKNTVIVASGDHSDVFGTTSLLPYISLKKLSITDMKQDGRIVLCYDGTGDLDDILDAVKKSNVVISCITGNIEKNLSKAVASNGVEYVATASISHPIDYLNKVKKALSFKTAFIQLLAPCPMAENKYNASNTVEVAKMAVESGLYPLYEAVSGVYSLTNKPSELQPVTNYYNLISVKKSPEVLAEEQKAVVERWQAMKKDKF